MSGRHPVLVGAGLLLLITDTIGAEQSAAPELPGTAITSSGPSVIDGLTEIVAGDNVLYVDASGRYLIVGSIYDLIEDRDLSAERRAEVRRPPADDGGTAQHSADPPLEAAVTTGEGPQSLTVIMDPDCGWCRRLWAESLRDLEGVRVHHLLPDGSEQTIGILCADDPSQALAQALAVTAITSKTPVPDADCRREAAAKIQRVARFIERSGLSGTPVLIRGDGAVHRGYLGRTALIAWLEGHDDAG